MDEIYRALAENLVIFFRDQHITPQQHLAFGRQFGELHIHPAAPHEPGEPALMKIYADKDSPRANGEGWHTDVSCDLEPPMGSILYIRQCPPRGGDTLFANMYAAYESLSERMKTYLDGLTALHDGEAAYRGLYANAGVADKPTYPSAEHPVVRTHPVTGKKALYVNRGFTRHISGIPRDESDAILAYLYQHAENPLFQCRFRWTENAIAFWDNRCAQHRAIRVPRTTGSPPRISGSDTTESRAAVISASRSVISCQAVEVSIEISDMRIGSFKSWIIDPNKQEY
jgi:taurine dioxygenase